ncbi:MAG: TRAP transporter large permease [Candidatus Polarisedimenticolaceae bacterium]|nr:TRAP transporter large permease [Candidatus Polarisedimenticolaceae bacterium]
MSLPLIIMLLLLIALLVMGTDIGPAMIVSGILYLLISGQDPGLAAEAIMSGLYNSFVLLAVPLFIFAANVMNAGTISDRLMNFSLALVGQMRGGLAQVNIMSSLIFSGMSGSAIADAAGMGKVMVGMMVKNNRYPPGFAAAITGASATIGPIIPPSIPMVLYAMVSDQSVGALFLGGVGPGLLMTAALMTTVWIIAKRRQFPTEPAIPWSAYPLIILRGIPPLLMPGILLGGIYGGIFTPTEAAAVAGLYALFLAGVVYRALGFQTLFRVFADTVRSSSVIALIIAGAFIINYVIVSEQIPNQLATWLQGFDLSPVLFMLLVSALFLLLGCMLDATTMLLVMVPIVLPTLKALGVDLVHFGVVVVVNMMIGLITPPYGVLLFVLNSTTGVPLKDIIRESWVFIAILLFSLLMMILFPDIVLWLPRVTGYYDG